MAAHGNVIDPVDVIALGNGNAPVAVVPPVAVIALGNGNAPVVVINAVAPRNLRR